jgi:hypothetical protein
MHAISRTFVFVAVLLLSLPLLPAQQKRLSSAGLHLRAALADLRRRPDDKRAQENYLKAFPRDYKTFLLLFGTGRELADGSDFVPTLSSLTRVDEGVLGHLLLQVCKDAKSGADAPNYLRHVTATYAAQHTKTFAALANRLSPMDKAHVVEFLALVENFDAYPEYQTITTNLRQQGDADLANEFVTARQNRIRFLQQAH